MPRSTQFHSPGKSQQEKLANAPVPSQSVLGGVNREEVDRIFSKASFDLIGWRITQGEYVSGEELAAAIDGNPNTALPDQLRHYLCGFLRGKVKKRRGPKKNYSLGREVIMITAALASWDQIGAARQISSAVPKHTRRIATL